MSAISFAGVNHNPPFAHKLFCPDQTEPKLLFVEYQVLIVFKLQSC